MSRSTSAGTEFASTVGRESPRGIGDTSEPTGMDEARAMLNILEDFSEEKFKLEAAQRALINILEDSAEEKGLLDRTQRAVLNILEDASEEKERLAAAQRALINILEDIDTERTKVEAMNRRLLMEIVERETAEKALLDKSNALARSNADLEQFAYVASHDLQEPLRMVANFTRLLQERYKDDLDERAHRYIEFAVDGARRMQILIQDLLAYSRVHLKGLEFRTVDCEEAFDQAVARLQGAIEESGATVTRGALPTVMGDPTQFVQLLQNLIGNAIKYRGAQRPLVRVDARKDAEHWTFSVRDNGIGIDMRHSERIFGIFQRLHTRDEYAGTGLGLALCRRIVERHGGRIRVESEPGRGADFFFTIPRTAAFPETGEAEG